jgi:NAD(P)-dependent dehydrogenase (short-subunit alcohol dehydrogenase family)
MGIFLKEMSLKGKTALITGATKGLGRGAAEAIAEAGGNIIAIGRNQSELNSLGNKIKKLKVKYTSFNCDVNNYNKIKNFISNLKKLDILVNNAGTNIPENFLNVKKTSLETLLNVNTKAVFNIAQLCANQIIKLKRKQGSIINISSIFGLVAGQKRTVYSMTKFGVEGLTKGMALDLAKYNIRVNSVCPNIVLTPRTKKYFSDKKYNKYVKESTPINKVVTISDVATSITFLASEASSMITGNIYYYRWRLDSKMKNVFLFIIIFFYSNISNAVEFRGKFEQGSFIIGKATKGSKIEVDKRKIRLTKDGYFAFGLDRDRKNNVIIKIHKNGKTKIIERKILKRDYKIQKIDGLAKKTSYAAARSL